MTETKAPAAYEEELRLLRAENQRLRDALERLKSNVWAWEVPDDVRQQVDEALAGDADA